VLKWNEADPDQRQSVCGSAYVDVPPALEQEITLDETSSTRLYGSSVDLSLEIRTEANLERMFRRLESAAANLCVYLNVVVSGLYSFVKSCYTRIDFGD
jgi:hypothetical protein